VAEATQIHRSKFRAFQATGRWLGHTCQDIVLSIGERSDRLAALLSESAVACGAFLTAFNPRRAIQPEVWPRSAVIPIWPHFCAGIPGSGPPQQAGGGDPSLPPPTHRQCG